MVITEVLQFVVTSLNFKNSIQDGVYSVENIVPYLITV